jgi:hypothetical protein
MRTALLSDVHGNRHAFEAVLAETAEQGVDAVWCLGDLVGYGADPNACVALARERCSIILAGNHDLAVTGDLSLDWATTGLTALVGNALAMDTRLAPLQVHDVAAAMQGLGPEASVEARVDALRQRTGARHVVHTRILREEQAYRLDYRVLATASQAAGTVYAGDLVRLGRSLARHLLRDLLPGTADGTDVFTLHDPWAMQLLARAMQASAEKEWTRALRMLRVVLDLEPDYEEARRELSRVEALAAPSANPNTTGGAPGRACQLQGENSAAVSTRTRTSHSRAITSRKT